MARSCFLSNAGSVATCGYLREESSDQIRLYVDSLPPGSLTIFLVQPVSLAAARVGSGDRRMSVKTSVATAAAGIFSDDMFGCVLAFKHSASHPVGSSNGRDIA